MVYVCKRILFRNKKNKLLMFKTTCMILKSVMLNERSQTKKSMHSIVSFILIIIKVKLLMIESRPVAARTLEE